MDAETLRAVADIAHTMNRDLSREAYETYDDTKRAALYEIAGAFGDFSDRLRHAAENSGL